MKSLKDLKKKSVFQNNIITNDSSNFNQQESSSIQPINMTINSTNKVFQVSKSGAKKIKETPRRQSSYLDATNSPLSQK